MQKQSGPVRLNSQIATLPADLAQAVGMTLADWRDNKKVARLAAHCGGAIE